MKLRPLDDVKEHYGWMLTDRYAVVCENRVVVAMFCCITDAMNFYQSREKTHPSNTYEIMQVIEE